MHILTVVGARPNMVKIAAIVRAMSDHSAIESTLLHTGQHYDATMSQVFFDQLGIPKPNIYLGVGSGSHAEQTARVMMAFEKVVVAERPDLVLVVGDVNSTLACALVAAKLDIPVAHVEAGLRSFNRQMPEEINRLLTDALSSYLFTTSRQAVDNLRAEGIAEAKIFFVGNVMIDTLLRHRDRALALDILSVFDLKAGQYAVLTLHRPANVDDVATLAAIFQAMRVIQAQLPILFPIHPRTRARLAQLDMTAQIEPMKNLLMVEPLGYLEFVNVMANAKFVMTDSGGIQEETTVLGVPCLTLRAETERPETVTEGTNLIVGTDPARILAESSKILAGEAKSGRQPELWDGRAAQRVVQVLVEHWGS